MTLRAAPSGQSLHGLSLLAEQQGSGPAAWSYYLPDALGSVRQVADPTGQVTLAQAYDPFGNLVYQSTHLPISPRYGFAGEEQDPLTGQVFLRARSYAPSTGRFLQADPLPGLPGQPGGLALPALVAQAQVSRVEGLHRYAYAFNNPVNYVDPAGTLPLFNGIQSPLSYRQDLSRLRGWAGQPLAPGGYASRSANAVGRGLRAWARQSEPLARFLSRGHRGLGCGFIGLVNSAGSIADYLDSFSRDPGSALSQLLRQANGNLRQGLRDLRDPDQWRQAYHDFLPLWYDYGGMVIGLLPIVGGIYDVVSLALERDLISGRPLTTVDRAIMSAGLLFSTLGFVDEALAGGSRLLRHLDEVDAAGVGRGLGHLDEATAFRLSHLDEFTAGDRALLRGEELRRALGSFDEGGALGRRLSHLDEVTAFRLSHLDEFTAGDWALLRGDELRRALGGFDDPRALSRRLRGSGFSAQANDVATQRALRIWEDPYASYADIRQAERTLQQSGVRGPWMGGLPADPAGISTRGPIWDPHARRWRDPKTGRFAGPSLPEEYRRAVIQFGIDEKRLSKYYLDLRNQGIEYEELINSFLERHPEITPSEAHAVFGYTMDLFYQELNACLRNQTGSEAAKALSNLINRALKKFPTAPGVPHFRGISLSGNALQDFLVQHRETEIATYHEFVSAAVHKTKWWDKSNVRVTIIPRDARDITELAFGVHFLEKVGKGPNLTQESLFAAGSQFRVNRVRPEVKDGRTIYYISLTQEW